MPGNSSNEDYSTSPHRRRVYEEWQGNEKFFCWGYLVAGPNWKSGLGSIALLAAPTVLFLIFVAPYMMWRVHVVLLVISCILPSLSLLYFLLTACRDPGILPRQDPDAEYLHGRKARSRDVVVNGEKVTLRYNDTCHFYQPPRAHHCSVNDNCVERFDHHCPWVGTTIGVRNYRTFLLFVFTTSVLCCYVFALSTATVFLRRQEKGQSCHKDQDAKHCSNSALWVDTLVEPRVIIALVLCLYTFLFFIFVGGLSGFHCYLVSSNQTTYENFRYSADTRKNPYDMGLLRNWAQVCCLPTPPSRINFRGFVDEEKAQLPDVPPTYAIVRPTMSTLCFLEPAEAETWTPSQQPQELSVMSQTGRDSISNDPEDLDRHHSSMEAYSDNVHIGMPPDFRPPLTNYSHSPLTNYNPAPHANYNHAPQANYNQAPPVNYGSAQAHYDHARY